MSQIDKKIVAWGGYKNFNEKIDAALKKIHVDYVYPGPSKTSYDLRQIPEIDVEQIRSIPNVEILICFARSEDIKNVVRFCTENGIPFTHVDIYSSGKISTRVLKALGGDFVDYRGNHVEVSANCSDNIDIHLGASDSGHVKLGNVSVRDRVVLQLFGSGSSIEIGDGTTIFSMQAGVNSKGKIVVGKDCMLSHSIELRQSDMHLIFDSITRKRINYPKDIVIGNHVWIGRGCELLGGANIGDNSIVGAKAVTSSSFPANVIIGGCPAKIIRTNVIWARDLIEKCDYDTFDQCKDQAALKYLPYSLKQEE